MKGQPISRRFVCYFHFNGWQNFNLGVSLCFDGPHIEVHVPSGFFKVGWVCCRHNDGLCCPTWGWDDSEWKWGKRDPVFRFVAR